MDYRIYLDFIKFCLKNDANIPPNVYSMDWNGCFKFCRKQAVLGIAFEGISRVNDLRIPNDVLYNWITLSEKVKNRNLVLNRRCVELQQIFADAGFRSCILKGQGNALMYPDPLIRTSGDIDLWVEGKRDEINSFVDTITRKSCKKYKDVSFLYKDVNVEVHYFPTYLNSFRQNRKIQNFIQRESNKQFSNFVELKGNEDKRLCVPTDDFNLVYQMCHIYLHFFTSGIGLRHFIDYYYLLNRSGKNTFVDYSQYGLEKFAKGVMWVEHRILGLDSSCLTAEPEEKTGRIILKEILQYGNFNHDNVAGKTVFSVKLSNTLNPFKYILQFPDYAIDRVVFSLWLQVWKLRNRESLK